MEYATPESLQDALNLLDDGGATVIAGTTDLFPGLKRGESLSRLVDVTRVPEIRGSLESESGWRFGGAMTWTELIRTKLPPAFDGLKAAAREVGSIQIQNSGTLAGNICNASPAADGVPPLIALGATVEIRSASGIRTVSLEDFIVGVRKVDLFPNEIVTAISVPRSSGRGFGSFLKLGSRRYLVISIAMVGALVDIDAQGSIGDCRIAVGACSPVARRLPELESVVVGMNAESLEAGLPDREGLFEPLRPVDDIRASSGYRIASAAELCRRALLQAVRARESANA